MISKGDTVEFQETYGTRTRRRVVTVVQTGERTGIGSDVFQRGKLLRFNYDAVTTVVKR